MITTDTQLLVRKKLIGKIKIGTQKPICVLVAPAGCGKTTLIRQTLKELDSQSVWININSDSITTILNDILTALATIIPAGRIDTLKTQGMEIILNELNQYLPALLEKKLIIVLDNIQNIKANSSLYFLELLLKTLKDKNQYILISRELPQAEYLAPSDQVSIITDDLYFTEREVTELARIIINTEDARPHARRVWSELRGWPIATIAALELKQTEFGNIRETIFSKAAEQMLITFDHEQKALLLDASILETITSVLCREVLEIDNPQIFLEFLSTKHSFINKENRSYHLHDLFQEYLLKELNKLYPEREKTLRSRLARHYQDIGKFENAFWEYHRIQDWRACLQVAIPQYNALHPGFATKYSNLHTALVRLLIEHPEEIEQAGKIEYIEFLYTIVATSAYKVLHFNPGEDWIIWVLKMAEQLKTALQLALKTALGGDLYFTRKNYDLGKRLIDEVLNCDLSYLDGIEEPTILAYPPHERLQFSIEFRTNNLEAAYNLVLRACKRMLPYLTNLHVEHYHAIYVNLISLGISLEKDEILEYIPIIEDMIRQYPFTDYAFFSIINYCEWLVGQGNFTKVKLLAEPYLNYGQGEYHWILILVYNQAILGLGDLPAALSGLRQVFSEIQKDKDTWLNVSNYPYTLSLLYSLYSYLGYPAAEYHMLDTILDELIQEETVETDTSTAFANRLLAKLDHRNIEAVCKEWDILTANTNVQISDTTQNRINFWFAYYRKDWKSIDGILSIWETRLQKKQAIFPALLDLAFKKDINLDLSKYTLLSEQVHQMQITQTSSTPDEEHPSIIEVYLIGTEMVKLDNQYIPQSEWLSSQNRLVLYYLILNGPTNSQVLADALWPDKNTQAASNNLRKAIQNLRETLGNATIIHTDNNYQLNPAIILTCDILELRKIVQQSKLLSHATARNLLTHGKVMSLIDGEFLTSIDRDWINTVRNEVQNLKCELLFKYANVQSRAGNPDAAIHVLQILRQFDPYREDVWRLNMEILSKMGESAKIALLYKEMCDLFRDDLGILPSQKTRDLYGTLISNEN